MCDAVGSNLVSQKVRKLREEKVKGKETWMEIEWAWIKREWQNDIRKEETMFHNVYNKRTTFISENKSVKNLVDC